MRLYGTILLIGLAVTFMGAGCGTGSSTGGGGKSGGGGNTTSTYLLYTDASSATLNVASISASGSLVAVNAPTRTGVQPVAVATTPDGKFAYVLNTNSSTVSQFAIGNNGSLTQPSAAIGTGLQPTAIAVDPQERFVVVTNTNSGAAGTLSIYSINQTTGVLTAVSTTAMPLNIDNPQTVTISGNFIYVADANMIDVLVYTPQTGTFAFANGSPFSAGTGTISISALYSPPQASTVLYAADTSNNLLLSFSLASGVLQQTGSFQTGTQPVALLADNQNRVLFVANQGSDTISIFSVNATTGALTIVPTTILAIGAAPNVLAYDPVNNFLMVSESGKKQILPLAVNTSTGGLSSLSTGLAVTNAPSGLAVAKP
jgi:DNA-binding beta-propeller fold protein YncE